MTSAIKSVLAREKGAKVRHRRRARRSSRRRHRTTKNLVVPAFVVILGFQLSTSSPTRIQGGVDIHVVVTRVGGDGLEECRIP